MTTKTKISILLSKIQIAVAAILFFVMLFFCGNYINIKMNGKISALPELSEDDLNLILRTAASDSVNNYDDMIEPVFIGIKNADSKICASINTEARNNFESLVYSQLNKLFSGYSKRIEFGSKQDAIDYIEKLKNSERFVLLSFFTDIPASVFLPCISQNYDIKNSNMFFNIRHLFLLSDDEKNLYGVAVSSDLDINAIYPDSPVVFNKTTVESYDIGEGFSHFEFDDNFVLCPVMTSSAFVNKVKIEPFSKIYGKEMSSSFVNRLFEVFTINENLVKSFSSRNYSEMNYVDDLFELYINDDGVVEFKSNDLTIGVGLDEYLGYSPSNQGKYSYNDKIFAVKNIVNMLIDKKPLKNYCVVGVDYEQNNDMLSVYLKSFINGGAVTQNVYDALFVICGNNLVYVKFDALLCSFTDEMTVCIPQKYANTLFADTSYDDSASFVPILSTDENQELYFFEWGAFFGKKEDDLIANK